MAVSFSLSNITDNSVTVTVIPDSSIPYYRIFCRLAANEDDVSFNASGVSITAPTSIVIPNLAPDTNYLVNVGTSMTGEQPWSWLVAKPFTTRGFAWEWAGLDANGSPVPGESKIKGYGVYVTAAEWGKLISAINKKKGTGLAGVSSGTPISAAAVRPAANALGVTPPAQDAAITAAFFNSLKDAVNS